VTRAWASALTQLSEALYRTSGYSAIETLDFVTPETSPGGIPRRRADRWGGA
jgi:hypothetical protein